ncbi:MAG: 4-hydroxy-tetrahydrodipicolinate synthase [Spirochaetales bacterium]|nr:4-hydroxy-tetrahydrodipicolinate synthase [Spirochaetales bacterium]
MTFDPTGLFTAIATPFTGDGKSIDYTAYAALLEKQIEAGVRGVVPCGTTGESPTLSHAEHEELIRKTVELVRGRSLVIGGTGSNATAEAIRLTEQACEAGVDAVMLVNPYYNKPTQEGLYQHFRAVARASSVPVILYNIRGRTAVNVENETMLRLLDVERIVAVKEASGDLLQMAALKEKAGDRLALLSGDDLLTPAVLSIGGCGVISVISNVYPRRTGRMVAAFLSGDYASGRKLFYELRGFMEACFWETNPIPVKAALAFRGLCTGSVRLPLTELPPPKKKALSDLMDRLGADQ